MYESPIELLVTEIQHQIVKQLDEEIYKAVLNYVPNVDKEELIRALQYDRGQYEKGYADAKAESGWIPVTERLPEENGYYLCEVCFSSVRDCKSYRRMILYWEDNVWIDMPNCFKTRNPTHWMPLPQPPKENDYDTKRICTNA